MAVVALPNIVPKGPSAGVAFEVMSNTGRFPSPSTGYTRTIERFGTHVTATYRYENLNGAEAARMRSFLMQCRGQANRFYAYPFGYTQRGSFPASELLTNNTFANGTTGWTPGSAVSLTASDGILRLNRTLGDSAANFFAGQTGVSVTQYAAYAMRVLTTFASPGETAYGASITDSTGVATSLGSSPALATAALPSLAASVNAYIDQTGQTGVGHGSYKEVAYASLARCAQVDNGPNALLRSNDGANAAWTKSEATAGDNGTAAPDGTATAQRLTETTNNAPHVMSQAVTVAAAAADFALTFYVGAANRSWCYLQMTEATGSSQVFAYFNASTGAVGTTGVGANWSNLRTFVENVGGGWYRFTIVARKSNAATTITAFFGAANADNSGSYAGVGTQVTHVWWRASLAASSFPVLPVLTTAAATTGTSQTGSALRLKGLPVSTAGLLLKDDLLEVITPNGSEIKRVSASLNSDASGLGYLQFEPPLRESPVNHAAVIVRSPMMLSLLQDRSVKWTQRQIGFTDLEFTAVEDMVA